MTGPRSLRVFAFALVFLAPVPRAARGYGGSGALGVELSARQSASGGAGGEYDVLGVADSPATLTAQPGQFDVNAGVGLLFNSAERALGLGFGWMNGSPGSLGYGLAAIVTQVSVRGFDEVDELGNATGGRVSPVARRIDVAAACQRSGISVGASAGTFAESYGSLPGGTVNGPGGMHGAAGVLASLGRWRAGVAYRFRPRDGGTGTRDVLGATGAVDLWGIRLTGDLGVPLAGPPGPRALAGIRCPASDAFDLRAGYAASFASGVRTSQGSSVRLGLSLRSTGVGMDYSIVVPLFSGLGVSHLIAVGRAFGSRSRTGSAAR